MTSSQSDLSKPHGRQSKKPWQLTSVRIAIVVTPLGLGLWIYSAFKASPSTEPSDRAASDPSLVSGFAGADAAASQGPGKQEGKLISDAAPATFRFGLSFLAGFALAWVMKRFIKLSLLIGGLLIAGICFLRRSGMIEMPWDQIEGQVNEGMSWVQGRPAR